LNFRFSTDTLDLDGQWATYTVKSNYFRFATITFNFTHNELSNIVDFILSDYQCGWTFNIAVYTALVSATDCNMSLLRARPIFLPNIQDGRQW